ncbi:MAG TPA: hypothetical protein VMF86_18410, partial [Stellaceae bacterium]|nr:hypothetical protein [Stellaceae bacterium]
VVTALPEVLRATAGLYLIIFSAAVMLMVLFMPEGLVGLWDWLVARIGSDAGGALGAAEPGGDAELG